ncbi:MAG: N-acetylmuramoyl-L-alanine amidase, partial [Salibacteraceae bacterium]|nr:N-acetylmuramoyl-L-alanine amidase [Salibacteraceae bacterium]
IMLLEANAVLAAFVLVYLLFFKKLTHFSLNRYLLLSAVVTSVLIGTINYEHVSVIAIDLPQIESAEIAEAEEIDTIAQVPIAADDTNQRSSLDNLLGLVFIVIMAGSAFTLVRFTLAFVSLYRQIKSTEKHTENVYVGENVSSAFSFVNRIYIPKSYLQLSPEKLQTVIDHEQKHLTLKHSFDTVFTEILKPLFWYNPLYWFLQKELKTIHEFQVDQWIQHRMPSAEYSKLLMELTVKSQDQNPLYQSFSMHALGRRIKTMNHGHSSAIHKVKYLLILPLVASLGYAFSYQHSVEYSFTSEPTETSNLFLFQLPLAKESITSVKPFGPRVNPLNKTRHLHKGVDLVAPLGTPILAAQSGKVRSVVTDQSGYGIRIIIDHNDSISTTYSHLQKTFVKQGQEVLVGEQIATCGSTGRSTGPHLHFEVILNQEVQDPKSYFVGELMNLGREKTIENSTMFTVVLDAGHGGEDGGIVANEHIEKDINLKAVMMLKQKLEAQNVNVVLTRSADETMSLKKRVDFTMFHPNAVFISLHANSAVESASGIDLYIPKGEDARAVESQKLAQLTEIELTNQNFKMRAVKQAPYFVLTESEVPAILIELGFMTNAEDLKQMNSAEYLEQMAEAIAKSIALYTK